MMEAAPAQSVGHVAIMLHGAAENLEKPLKTSGNRR
jgi:hypothetical protein